MTDPNTTQGQAAHDDAFAARFDALRGRLTGIAYGLLGSLDEAEDVVQDAWLRLVDADRDGIDDLTGWLIVTVARLAQDVLKSARKRREAYVGPWLPEPLVTEGHVADPADRVTLDESLSVALLVVLEALSPAERTAFVLHDIFGFSFAEVGAAVGRTPAACRQLAARARRHVAERAPRFEVSADEQRRVVAAFAVACHDGDTAALLRLLDPRVELRADGGGRVRTARNPIYGADRVSRYLTGLSWLFRGDGALAATTVNGRPGLLWRREDALHGVFGIAVAEGRITGIDIIRNPDKLLHVTRFSGEICPTF